MAAKLIVVATVSLGLLVGIIVTLFMDVSCFVPAVLALMLPVIYYGFKRHVAGTLSPARTDFLTRANLKLSEAISRYIKPGEQLGEHSPALILDNQACYAIRYHPESERASLTGLLLFDEQGTRQSDEKLFARAMKCHQLAAATLEHVAATQRSSGVERTRMLLFRLKRLEKELFGKRSRIRTSTGIDRSDLEDLRLGISAARRLLESRIKIAIMEATWSVEKGTRKLKDIRYEDVIRLESSLSAARTPYLRKIEDLERAVEPARRVAAVYLPTLEGDFRQQVSSWFQFLSTLAQEAKEGEPFELYPPSEHELKVWRERMAYADQVDSGHMPDEA